MRSRGIGSVEFDSRENLIEALKKTDKEVYGRKIRISFSDKTDSHQADGGRSTFGNRSNRSGGGEERPEMAGQWKRAERKYLHFFNTKKETCENYFSAIR
jgi:RNA recognition motif-containing protein